MPYQILFKYLTYVHFFNKKKIKLKFTNFALFLKLSIDYSRIYYDKGNYFLFICCLSATDKKVKEDGH